ncbi:hypothetical protein MHU86_19660 [Fragilaria crotonensis]|nr:hypothetical protein MHU86_19660 [Fragilaria crotonensis]
MRTRTLPVEIAYKGQVISSHYVRNLRTEISLDRHRTFLKRKYKWSDRSWEDIAWDSFHLCGDRTSPTNTAFRSKLVHNWLHLGTRRAKQSKTPSDHVSTCPICDDAEDFQHFLTCPSPRALRIRYDATSVLRKQLGKTPGTTALYRAIQAWTAAPDEPVQISPGARTYATSVDDAITSQTSWMDASVPRIC